MKKHILLLLPLILSLGACSNTPKEESKDSLSPSEEVISESIISEESLIESIEESVSIEDSLIEEESTIDSESIDDSESEDDITSKESENVPGEVHTLSYDDVPDPISGGYPNPGIVTTSTNDQFYLNQVMKGGGDYNNHIQMKKGTSYLYNLTPFHGTLTFAVLKQTNFYNNEEHDFTGVPTVYVGTNKDSIDEVLEPRSILTRENYVYYDYEAGVYSYYKIADESNYAMYVTSFTWAC